MSQTLAQHGSAPFVEPNTGSRKKTHQVPEGQQLSFADQLYPFCTSDHLFSITNLLRCLVRLASHLESTLPARIVNTQERPDRTTRKRRASGGPVEPCPAHEKNQPKPIDTAQLVRDISFPSYPLRTLELSCRTFSRPRPLFSILYTLFAQNTRGCGCPIPNRGSK